MKHLDFRNPNADALVVPQEEGGTDDDNYFGSIGDATMRHVQSLSGSQRQLWEELVHVRSGSVFQVVPSYETNDPDPFNLRDKDLKQYLDNYKDKVSPGTLSAIKEAIEIESQRREASEDAMDRAELIPYSDWENNPQMWKHTDIPSTPKDRFRFMGNTTQPFYDSFPEGHPDQAYINKMIMMVDRAWSGDDSDIKYAAYLKQEIDKVNLKLHTKKFLSEMVDKLAEGEGNPSDIVEEYLHKIDEFFGKRYREHAIQSSKTAMSALLDRREQDWEQRFKSGQLVLDEVRRFGFSVYNDKELQGQMTSSLWARYENMKTKFAPRLMVQGVDINRCRPQELKRVLHLTDKEARDFWFNRPYQTLYQENVAKYLNQAQRHHTENPVFNKILDGLEGQYNVCIQQKNLTALVNARVKMNTWQQKGSFDLSTGEWNSLWNYYRILRDAMMKTLKAEQNQHEGQEENV
jgi:hypothetical protein